MTKLILIPDGTTATKTTEDAGDLLVLGSGESLTVDGATAVELDEANTALVNDGAITASDAPAVLGDEASVRIVNGGGDPAASITSDDSAIRLAPLDGATQEVINLGTIDGAFNGIDFQGATGSSSKLFNAGLVTSDSRALNIVADDVQVVNQGTIRTTADPRNGVLYTDTQADATTVVNAAGGVVDAGAGNDGDAVSLQVGDDVALSVSNAGVFQGRGEPGDGGQASGLRVLAGTEPNPGFNGTLLNKGLIASEATTGIGAGVLVEDGIDADGQLVNQGEIVGPFNGLYLGDGDYADFFVFNGASGSITSASRAVNINGDGLTLVNAGTISHTGDGRNGVVYADDTADGYSVTNTARGVIDAGEGLNGDAVSLQLGDEVHAGIVNAGHVLGRGEAALSGLASGVRLFSGAADGSSLFHGTIDNAGRITSEATTGVSAGVLVEDGVSFRGEIHNSGEIAGPFNGIYVGDDDHELTITNAEDGRIASNSRAVNIGGDGVTLLNHGAIVGTGDSRNGLVYSDDESNLFEIVNSATGVVDAGEGNDSHAVSVELAVASRGVIDNHGLLFGRGESAAIRLFSNPETAGPEGSVFEGRISSHGTIRTEDGPGILIEENVAVTVGDGEPAVVVTGDILADLALDATAMSAGLAFTQALGHIVGDLRFGAGDDDVNVADEDLGGGGRVDGEIHLGAGDDTLDWLNAASDLDVSGGTGDDEILGGAGDDVVTGGPGHDRIFSGAGDDIVLGGDGDDAIDGGAGLDTIAGGDGDDEVFAGADLDLVSGGDGADTFFFAPVSDVDVVTDFDAAEGDLIDLTLFGSFASGDEGYAAGANVAGDAVWDLGDGDTLTLADTDYASLSGDAFIV